MVRPQMEYTSAVWDPCYNSQIQQLEKVQRRAARWIYKTIVDLAQCKDYPGHLLRHVVR